MSTYTELRAVLGDLADVTLPHLRGQYWNVRRGMAELSKAHDAALDTADVLAPGVELYPYQRAGVAFARTVRRCVIGHGMGLGKTLQAITVMALDGGRWLVIVPPTLVRNWEREIAKFAPQLRVHSVFGEQTYTLPTDVDVVVIGDAVVAHWAETLKVYGFDHIVIDEFQRFKTRDANRVESVVDISRWVPGYRIGLTGTFAKNGPREIIAPMRIIGVLDDLFGGVMGFLDLHFPKVDEDAYEREAVELEQLHETMADSFYARLTMDDVRYQLGDKAPQGVLRNVHGITLAGPKAEAYRAARDDFRQYLRDNDRSVPEKRAQALVRMSELRKLIAAAKIEAAVDFVQQLVDQGDQVIVFATHRSVTKELAKRFKAPTIIGGDNPDAVEAGKDAFQAGEARVIVCNIAAGGVGHTLTAAKHVVFVEFGWTPADMEQAEARADRIGSEGFVQSHWLVGTNGESTIDERIISILNTKAVTTGLINDGKATIMIEKDAVEDALLEWAAGNGEIEVAA